jgi:hypothetical protein
MFPGHNVGAGKGDKPRHRFDQSYRDNHDAIDWSGSVLGWEQHDGKQVKRYGVAAPIADRAPHVRVK